MDRDELLGKLVNEVACHRLLFKALLWALAARLNPEDPEAERQELMELTADFAEQLRPAVTLGIAKEWELANPGVPSPEPWSGGEFEAWFQRQFPRQS